MRIVDFQGYLMTSLLDKNMYTYVILSVKLYCAKENAILDFYVRFLLNKQLYIYDLQLCFYDLQLYFVCNTLYKRSPNV